MLWVFIVFLYFCDYYIFKYIYTIGVADPRLFLPDPDPRIRSLKNGSMKHRIWIRIFVFLCTKDPDPDPFFFRIHNHCTQSSQ